MGALVEKRLVTPGVGAFCLTSPYAGRRVYTIGAGLFGVESIAKPIR
jgi:hypothetical protein